MNLTLFSNNSDLCLAWECEFQGTKVDIVYGDFRDDYNRMNISALVSPANSFGLMDGGFDQVIIDIVGPKVMESVQRRINLDYGGEQPVGTAFAVKTDHFSIPLVIHSPTMRTPMNIVGTNNCFHSTRAALLVGRRLSASDPNFRNVAMTGMGTLTGGLDFNFAARQMRLAYDVTMNFNVTELPTWSGVDNLGTLLLQTHIGRRL
jgi:O-acetyl-ADP-ribose deacetylase (regulator of RNase III)